LSNEDEKFYAIELGNCTGVVLRFAAAGITMDDVSSWTTYHHGERRGEQADGAIEAEIASLEAAARRETDAAARHEAEMAAIAEEIKAQELELEIAALEAALQGDVPAEGSWADLEQRLAQAEERARKAEAMDARAAALALSVRQMLSPRRSPRAAVRPTPPAVGAGSGVVPAAVVSEQQSDAATTPARVARGGDANSPASGADEGSAASTTAAASRSSSLDLTTKEHLRQHLAIAEARAASAASATARAQQMAANLRSMLSPVAPTRSSSRSSPPSSPPIL
jgi:hypothetical protein